MLGGRTRRPVREIAADHLPTPARAGAGTIDFPARRGTPSRVPACTDANAAGAGLAGTSSRLLGRQPRSTRGALGRIEAGSRGEARMTDLPTYVLERTFAAPR